MTGRTAQLAIASRETAAAIIAGEDCSTADIVNEPLGQLQILRFRSENVIAGRSAGIQAGRSRPAHTFLLQLDGNAELRQAGNRARLGCGDITLYDQRLPYSYRSTGPCEIILLRVPAPLLCQSLAAPEELCGRRLGCEEVLTATAAAMATALTDQLRGGLDEVSRRRVANHLLGIMSTCFAPEMDRLANKSSLMSNRLWQVKMCVEQHLRNPKLSPAFVATELRISPRYLRMIFASGKESILGYILRRRLEECAAKLADPQWRGHSITEIAFSYGFNSAPHFTRTFRERFGIAPREYRQRSQDGNRLRAVA